MSCQDLQPIERMLATAVEAAREAGRILMDRLYQPLDIRSKGLRDLVTEADLAAEEAILRIIQAGYADHVVLSEESEIETGESDYLWIVDPLDGTTNYSRRFPFFSTSIALTHRAEVLVGVVYDPLRDWMFHARKGQGVYLDDRPLRVSQRDELGQSLIGLDWAREQEDRRQTARLVSVLAPKVVTLRATGSAAMALCMVGAGWLDGYFNLAVAPWDTAAASLIIQEAGGTITDIRGNPFHLGIGHCLASNGLIHQQLLQSVPETDSGERR
ncbi:MAG: inositol monophosphatase family protein [Anaerolineae bacterium]